MREYTTVMPSIWIAWLSKSCLLLQKTRIVVFYLLQECLKQVNRQMFCSGGASICLWNTIGHLLCKYEAKGSCK